VEEDYVGSGFCWICDQTRAFFFSNYKWTLHILAL